MSGTHVGCSENPPPPLPHINLFTSLLTLMEFPQFLYVCKSLLWGIKNMHTDAAVGLLLIVIANSSIKIFLIVSRPMSH